MSGLGRHQVGLAAEDQVARLYADRGATILARRHRSPAGEIDLIVLLHGILIFVEVKRRKTGDFDGVIPERQWRRLEQAATAYIFDAQTKGVIHGCRFDAALIGPDGTCRIIENARGF